MKKDLGTQKLIKLALFLVLATLFSKTSAQTSGDVVGAKAFLESLIIKRISQELSSKVDQGSFSIGAHLEVQKRAPEPPKPPPYEPLSDIDLGFLDPDVLFKNYAVQGTAEEKFLESYTIRKVEIFVGLKESLGEEVLAETEKWLGERVSAEFGNIGSGVVRYIHEPIKPALEIPPQKDILGHLRDFQELAGRGLLALAAILGVLIWVLLGKSTGQKESGSPMSITSKAAEAPKPQTPAEISKTTSSIQEEETLRSKIAEIKGKIFELTSKTSGDLEKILKGWCEEGDEGSMKVAAFAEVSGKVLGRLPISPEHKKSVASSFSKLGKSEPVDQMGILDRVYWDLVAAVNLGSESLKQPFSFLGGMAPSSINEVLMDNNVKLQAVASVYMPEKSRKAYLSALDKDKKIELLEQASGLTELSENELLEMETSLSSSFGGAVDLNMVPFGDAFSKLVDSLNILEACELLKVVSGPMLDLYKRSVPHVAFLDEWSDDALKKVLSKSSNDEILAFLSVRLDAKDRVLGLVPPMVQRILQDDISRVDGMKETDRESGLVTISQKMRTMVLNGEVDLGKIFQRKSVDEPSVRAA